MQEVSQRTTKASFYVTTTLPYVNAPLHLGHATEIIRADAIARYKKLMGYEVFFNTGTDEHGLKIYESAQKDGNSVQEHVDEYAALYKTTVQKFGILPDAHYIRTTDALHVKAAQEFWKRCDSNGFIYKKNYQSKYCIGCEEEKTDSELVDGKCPEHNRVPELINEENYFFKLSAFGEKLLALYDANPEFVVPVYRVNELREFIKRGLKDFSISRVKEKMPWGIPVPTDKGQVMYVWFDALVNYISTLGWPDENGDYKKFWVNGTPVQYCGKDNVRFQGLMWQAMLMAAGLSPTHTIVVDGFILGEGGVKMSKTLGNSINPLDIVAEYGTDALRYFVLREFHPFEDTAVSKEKLTQWYNANLANGIGNLTSRIIKMTATHGVSVSDSAVGNERRKAWATALEAYRINEAADIVWRIVQEIDVSIQREQPFKTIKTDPEKAKKFLAECLGKLLFVGELLLPIMPDTAERIRQAVLQNKLSTALFPRKE